MIDGVSILVGVGSASMAAGVATWWAARRHRPVRERLERLESDLAAERAAGRRRDVERARSHEREVLRLRRAASLPLDGEASTAPRGRQLATLVEQRLAGWAGLSAVVVSDEHGLAWTGDDSPTRRGLAALSAVALRSRVGGQLPWELHAELEDARHVVVRPLPGTRPALALVVASSSRPAPRLALDAVSAWVSAVTGDDGGDVLPDPLVGHAFAQRLGSPGLAGALVAELEAEARSARLSALALAIGDDLVAVHAEDGPPPDGWRPLHATTAGVAGRVGHVLGSRVRRLDWTSEHGTSASWVAVGQAGRSHLLAIRRGGAADVSSFDRLAGRLRRLMPADAPRNARTTEARPS